MATATIQAKIVSDPDICGGKPRLAGRRITVQDIVIWHEWQGRSADEISNDYDLSLAEVYGALSFYFDHMAEIDQRIRDDEAFAANLKKQTHSKVQQKIGGQ